MTERIGKQTDFGFRRVPLADKQAMVDGVFDSVAKRYDLMNDLMSGGLHRAWKDALVTAVNPPPKAASRLKNQRARLRAARSRRRHRRRGVPRGARRAARARASPSPTSTPRCWRSAASAPTSRASTNVTFIEGNAEKLPLPDRAFDAVTIAFGIRNVPRIDVALAEAHRVLRIGGRFLCLEFSNVDVPGLDAAVRPLFVQRHSGDRPRGHRRRRGLSLSGRIDPQVSQARGVRRDDAQAPASAACRIQPLTGGIVAIHSGWRL